MLSEEVKQTHASPTRPLIAFHNTSERARKGMYPCRSIRKSCEYRMLIAMTMTAVDSVSQNGPRMEPRYLSLMSSQPSVRVSFHCASPPQMSRSATMGRIDGEMSARTSMSRLTAGGGPSNIAASDTSPGYGPQRQVASGPVTTGLRWSRMGPACKWNAAGHVGRGPIAV